MLPTLWILILFCLYFLADVVHGMTVALLLLNTDLHSDVSFSVCACGCVCVYDACIHHVDVYVHAILALCRFMHCSYSCVYS